MPVQTMIHAGTIADIRWSSGKWVFLDVGFSNDAKTCGLLIDDAEPVRHRFNEATAAIIEIIRENCDAPTNLTIEAPLSVAFDKHGNPKRRRMEKQGGQTRYWYTGPGCAVMVAALYLVRAICNAVPKQQVRIFEGFVSYKRTEVRSDHLRDVLLLRKTVKTPEHYPTAIIGPDLLNADVDDKVVSAFQVAGLDFGIPPVIKCDG